MFYDKPRHLHIFMLQISCITDTIFLSLQSDNPNGGTINPLGIYLLISLFFVMTSMIEFAGITYIQRKNRLIGRNKVTHDGRLKRRGSFEMDQLAMKIDSVALVTFSLGYILFNYAYWTTNLILQ